MNDNKKKSSNSPLFNTVALLTAPLVVGFTVMAVNSGVFASGGETDFDTPLSANDGELLVSFEKPSQTTISGAQQLFIDRWVAEKAIPNAVNLMAASATAGVCANKTPNGIAPSDARVTAKSRTIAIANALQHAFENSGVENASLEISQYSETIKVDCGSEKHQSQSRAGVIGYQLKPTSYTVR